ncbi:MAG: hypothetical protein ACFFB0_03470 [Promethearchaeota archaeon]
MIKIPRILTLQYKDLEIPTSLKIFSRNTLYGRSMIEKRGAGGEVYRNAYLTADGTHILPSKSISAQYVDPRGDYIAETMLVDADGKAIPITRSMYKEPVELSKTISLEDFFSYNVERTYILTSEQEEELNQLYLICKKLLAQDKLFHFTYAYYDTTNPRDAILLPKDNQLFVVDAEFADLILLKPSEILYSDIEEEELEEEIAFEVW